MIEAKFSAKFPKWRVVIPGVNLVGTHEIDSSCCAKGQTDVESQHGVGFFNIGKEICQSFCPLCKQSLKNVTNVVFSQCKFKIDGMTKDKKKINFSG